MFICGFLLLLASPAAAWEQAFTRETPQQPLHVRDSNCLQYTLHDACSEDVAPEDCWAAVHAGMDTWNAVAGSYFRFEPTAPASCCRAAYQREGANANCISWLEGAWPDAYPPAGIALTTITYDVASGAILDADIELNGFSFQFGTTCAAGLADVQNTVTHEAGHMLGLDHTDVPGATMRSRSYPGDCELRSLEADDTAGLVTIYPAADDPGICRGPTGGVNLDCSAPDDCGCRAAGAGRGAPGWLALAAVAVLAVRLRRRP
ncbi:MAG: matrixin family metalloprotease [Deltaproteobacteria bacterium]|nr:matrixin family metalloprotease [Deltaproteobacteria bacterium]